jgi:translation initiation factor IF-2
VATILVQNGTLNPGDFFICGSVFGKVRAMFDDHGRPAKNGPPSTPVEVLGLQGVPEAGDHFQVTDEAKARHIVDYRQGKQRDAAMARSSGARITFTSSSRPATSRNWGSSSRRTYRVRWKC